MTAPPQMLRVLHIIQQLSRGGAARSLLGICAHAIRERLSTPIVVSLCAADAGALRLAADGGVPIVESPSAAEIERLIHDADIVEINYWNTPELLAFCRTLCAPARIVLWAHVRGDQPPHLVHEAMVGWADAAVAAAPQSPGLVDVVLDSPDFSRLRFVTPQPHNGFRVGYIGTVDPVKMHPEFVRMCAAVDIADARFVVCGSGDGFSALQREAEQLGVGDRFEWRGYVEDVASIFETLDVFGYPFLYGAGELVLQEAMYAGVPPVVLPPDGAWTPVDHERTGLVVATESEFSRALESLARNDHRRRALGAAAADDARRRFGASRSAEAMHGIYERMMQSPKRPHVWPFDGVLRQYPHQEGARAFISLLGREARHFGVSLAARTPEEALAAEMFIAASSPAIVDSGAGGLLHYRRCYLQDAHLRLWSGLVLANHGRPALAIAELEAARRLGLDHWRVSWHLAGIARSIGASELALDALGRVVRDAPHFEPGQAALAALGGAR